MERRVNDDGGGWFNEVADEADEAVEDAAEFARRHVEFSGAPVVRTGEDEAGPWWELAEDRRDPDVRWCLATTANGNVCKNRAGAGTNHLGAGPCSQHGGGGRLGSREGAWIVAHGFARQLDVTPWEGLLVAVKIAAGRVAWIEAKLAGATEDRQLEPVNNEAISEPGRDADHDGTNLSYWVKQAEVWHDRLARVSKLAIDAGVAERLVRQLELEAQLMLRATNLTLDELGLDDDTRRRALGIMSRNLLALEAQEVGEGEENEREPR